MGKETVAEAFLGTWEEGRGYNRFLKSPRVKPVRKLTDTFLSHQTSITITIHPRVTGD
jgi:hypothetical protein